MMKIRKIGNVMYKCKRSTIKEARPKTGLRHLSKSSEFTIIIINYNEHPLTPQEKYLRNTKEETMRLNPISHSLFFSLLVFLILCDAPYPSYEKSIPYK